MRFSLRATGRVLHQSVSLTKLYGVLTPLVYMQGMPGSNFEDTRNSG